MSETIQITFAQSLQAEIERALGQRIIWPTTAEPDNEDISELLLAMRAGHWPPLPEIKPITTNLAKLL